MKFPLTFKQSFSCCVFLMSFFFCLMEPFIITFLGFQFGCIFLILHLSALRSGWILGTTLFHSKNPAFHEFKT